MVIDFHTHVFPDKVAARTVSALQAKSGSTPYSDGTTLGLLSNMRRAGVSLSVNLPVLTKPEQFESILSFCSELNRAYGPAFPLCEDIPLSCDPRILSFLGIHPADADVEEKLHRIKDLGFLGIKIHPDYQGVFFDDERYIKILSLAKKLGLITVTHAGVDGAYIGEEVRCTPTRVLRALDKIGGYPKLVLAHFGANLMSEEFFCSLSGEDVYIDTANLMSKTNKALFLRYLERHGEDRILFATDSPWSDISADVKKIRDFGLPAEIEDKITHKNAIGLLSSARS